MTIDTDIQCFGDVFRTYGQVELCCPDCESAAGDIGLADSSFCAECGGPLVGIEFFRNTPTGKVIYAERIDR